VGVHAYGFLSCPVHPTIGVQNCGPRIDADLVNYIQGFGATSEFFTDLIAAPIIFGPADLLLTNEKVTFSWAAHPDAAKYELEVWKWNNNKGEYQRKIRKKTTRTEWSRNLGTGFYVWRVRIEQPNKFPGQWSSPFYLEVDKKRPGRPTLVAPPHRSTVGTAQFFEWIPPADADIAFYEIQANDRASGWNPPHDQATTPNPFIQGLFPDGTWYWRVRAWDHAGNAGKWSQKWKFTATGSSPTIMIGEQGAVFDDTYSVPPPVTRSSRIPVIIPIGAEAADTGVPVFNID
jgi:hypothetical protein